jgi:CheY-like chemotaxis protein
MTQIIMMVDDNPAVLRLYSSLMETSGHRVLTALDAATVLELVDGMAPDLFVLDVMMPGMDGIEVCQHLRARPATSHKPIIMLSAKGDPDTVEQAFAAGADLYLVKPVQPRQLLEHVQSQLTTPSSSPCKRTPSMEERQA